MYIKQEVVRKFQIFNELKRQNIQRVEYKENWHCQKSVDGKDKGVRCTDVPYGRRLTIHHPLYGSLELVHQFLHRLLHAHE